MIQTKIFASLLAFVLSFGLVQNVLALPEAEATGCPKDFINEHLKNAITAYNEGDMAEVKNQLDLAAEVAEIFEDPEEMEDTYNVEDE